MYGYYYKEGKSWEDVKLWETTKDNPQEDINIESFLNQNNYWNIGSFKELAKEMQLVLKADYSYPIILDKEHKLVDGAHRLVHAYLDGKTYIKGVIIKDDQWPEPDYDEIKACQNKQKPIIEVKSKFKVGDWVLFMNKHESIYQVEKIENGYYILRHINGGIFKIRTLYNEDLRLWTIEDAKDGDILSYITDDEDLWIMIYRSLYEPYKNHVHYRALLVNDDFSDKGTCCIDIDYLKPATKKQRDLLFQKIKESGYNWNSYKKELINIV